jgi:NAD-dependent protein deacetylase/lipoamidase
MVTDEQIQQASNHIRTAKQLTVLTGAGVSKESGVPTFRDALDGLWARFDPTQLATRQAFEANPKLVWDFYEYRREIMRPAQPNPGHYALAELQRRFPHMRIITQNIDNLHERAGNRDIIRLHGAIAQNKCYFDCQGAPTLVDISMIEWDKASGPPPCPHCGRWVRPNVVWFGEMLPADQLYRAKNLLLQTDVMLVIGTSGLVSPAADMPARAKDHGAIIIEINPDTSMITRIANLKLEGPSGEILPRIVAALA